MIDDGVRLDGKVALVTGASRGIGLAVARRLLEFGARVALVARRAEGLEVARRELEGEAGGRDRRIVAVTAHSAREEQVRAAFEAAESAFGVVDIVVNNAATNPSMEPLTRMDLAAFDKVIDTNLRGYLLVAREAVRRLRARGATGAILNVSTVGARRAMSGLGAYGVGKAAVDQLTRALAAELGPEGIRVNGVAPGVIRTRFSAAMWSPEGAEERLAVRIPLRRIGEPDDVATAIAFLVSDAARYITGETLLVDGGLLTA